LENIVDSIIVFILLLAFNGITLYPFVLLWFVYYRKADRKAHYKTVVKYAFAFLVVFQKDIWGQAEIIDRLSRRRFGDLGSGRDY